MSTIKSRIFSTGIGIHPAEPCSLSVAATHQLLTNLLVYLMVSPVFSPWPYDSDPYEKKVEESLSRFS